MSAVVNKYIIVGKVNNIEENVFLDKRYYGSLKSAKRALDCINLWTSADLSIKQIAVPINNDQRMAWIIKQLELGHVAQFSDFVRNKNTETKTGSVLEAIDIAIAKDINHEKC